MLGAQSVARAFPEYPTTIVRVHPPAVHLKDYISMAGPEIMTVGKSDSAQKTFQVCLQIISITLSVVNEYSLRYSNFDFTMIYLTVFLWKFI